MTDGQLGALRCSKKRLSSAAEHGPRNMQLPRIAQERNFQSRKLTKCKPDLEYINKYFSCTLKMETSNVACVGVVEGGEEHSIAVNSLTFAYPGVETRRDITMTGGVVCAHFFLRANRYGCL